MIELAGTWFDGNTSRQVPATLRVHRSGEFELAAADHSRRGRFTEFELSAPLGDTARQLALPDGAVFETRDHAGLAKIRDWGHHRHSLELVHLIERHWGAVLGLTVLTAVIVYLGMVYGVPSAARSIAYALPASMLDSADEQTLAVLDRAYFEPSELPQARREALRAEFESRTPALAIPVRIEFRKGGEVGANAFALPGGTVVFTDEMVELAQDDRELLAVYGHELGHLEYRHSLRRAIQGSIVTIAAVLLLGDATATTDVVGAVPLALTDLAWSRDFEREADSFALDFMSAEGIDPGYFASLMQRLECRDRARTSEGFNQSEFDACIGQSDWTSGESGLGDFLSTHPATRERIQRFQEAADSAR